MRKLVLSARAIEAEEKYDFPTHSFGRLTVMDNFTVASVILLLVIRNSNSDVQENVLNGAHLKIATAAVRIFLIFYYSNSNT